YGAYMVLRQEVGKNPFGDLAVFDHVRYTRRGTEIVFQNIKSSVAIADKIDAGNVNVDVVRNMQPLHFAQVVGAGVDKFDRDNAILEDELVVVNIPEKEVERPEPL